MKLWGLDRKTIVEAFKPLVNFYSGCLYQFVAFFIFVIALAFFFYFLSTNNVDGMMVSGGLLFLVVPLALIFYMLEHLSRPE